MPGVRKTPTLETFDLEIFLREIEGGALLREARVKVGMVPDDMYDLLRDYPEFANNFYRAREAGFDEMAEGLLEIAKDEPDVRRADVRIKATQWYLARRKPQTYGDRLDVHVTKTVDIGSALAEAARRALTQRAEIVDITPKTLAGQEPAGDPESIDDLLD